MRMRLGIQLAVVTVAAALWGCDPLTLHKVTSTVFDGVPSMPPATEYCQDYHEQKLLEEKEAALKKLTSASAAREAGSSHRPYREKRCSDCHDKNAESGLIKPTKDLCFHCHPKILNGYFQHGPASVGSCLECHEPHSAGEKSLLKVAKGNLCAVCHKETRLAKSMHDKVTAAGLLCTDCHDPHAGGDKYFLK